LYLLHVAVLAVLHPFLAVLLLSSRLPPLPYFLSLHLELLSSLFAPQHALRAAPRLPFVFFVASNCLCTRCLPRRCCLCLCIRCLHRARLLVRCLLRCSKICQKARQRLLVVILLWLRTGFKFTKQTSVYRLRRFQASKVVQQSLRTCDTVVWRIGLAERYVVWWCGGIRLRCGSRLSLWWACDSSSHTGHKHKKKRLA